MPRLMVGAVFLTLATISGQQSPRWIGSWQLDPTAIDRAALAAFGPVPADQSLRIRLTDETVEIAGETTLVDVPGVYREDMSLRLDGTTTTRGPVTLSVTSFDDSSFEIRSSAVVQAETVTQISRFVVSTDGTTLTETKARTIRPASSAAGTASRSPTVTLVFHRLPARDAQQ